MSLFTGEIGRLPGLRIVQSALVGIRHPGEVLVHGDTLVIPATRPSLHFPLTEAVAAAEGIDLWYFDPAKWPDRVRVDPATYLGLRR